jgi:ketosteroid isomerase-like protein
MESENTLIVRRCFERINAGDVEGAKELAHPEIEIRTRLTSGLSGNPYKGHGGVEQYFADLIEDWETVDQEVERILELDARHAASVVRFKARGRGSGVEIDQEIAATWTISDGRVIRIESHETLDEALASVAAPKDPAG